VTLAALINPATRVVETIAPITCIAGDTGALHNRIVVPLAFDKIDDADHLIGRAMPDVYRIAAGARPYGVAAENQDDEGGGMSARKQPRQAERAVRVVYLICCRATGKAVEAHVARATARASLSIWNNTAKPGYRLIRCELIETTRSGGGA
jgi:hypothetical protein